MKILYISGPFSPLPGDADPLHSTEHNILQASRYALLAARKGWAPFCPHKNTSGFHHVPDLSEEFWLECCLEYVRRCDAVLMIPGWERSEGAKREYYLAHALGKPIFRVTVDGMVPEPGMVRE